MSEIDVLLSSLTTSIAALKGSLETQGLPPFRSDDITPHPLDTGVPDPTTFYARRAIVGLCSQIVALVQAPAERSATDSFGTLLTACLTAATETTPSVAELVLESGPAGIELNEVAQKTGIDPIKLRSIARRLAASGYVKEATVGHYVPTRSTLALVPGGGPVAELNHLGFSAAAAALPQVMRLPSSAETPTAFEANWKMPLFNWLQQHPSDLKRFHRGMTQVENHLDKGISADVNFDDLGDAITLVDVGAGHGGLTMQLLKRHPRWKAILQDRPEVIPEARQFWQDNMPEALETGRIGFLPHSFMEPTPLPPAPEEYPYVFMIKSVLHNWPDDTVTLTLKNLLPASPPGTKLIIVNFTPSSPDPSRSITIDEYFDKLKGKSMHEVQALSLPDPAPLNVGFGAGNQWISDLDMLMMLLLNSRARTTADFEELLQTVSWKLDGLVQLRGASSVLRATRA